MLDMQYLESLNQGFTNIGFREKRSGLFKILVPFFHEDGDMYDLFIEECPKNKDLLRISDYGLTLMRLSYNFEIDTPRKQEVLESTVLQNRCSISNGMIYLDLLPNQFNMGIYQFAQVITKVAAMDILSYDTVQSMFYDYLNSYMAANLRKYNYTKNYSPTKDNQLVVDYSIPAQSGSAKPLFIFGVNENTKASKVVISCLSFQKQKIPFRSLIIHENFDNLSSFNRNQITNAADKQFVSLDDFRTEGIDYIERELAS
jgi:hypothetical protein